MNVIFSTGADEDTTSCTGGGGGGAISELGIGGTGRLKSTGPVQTSDLSEVRDGNASTSMQHAANCRVVSVNAEKSCCGIPVARMPSLRRLF